MNTTVFLGLGGLLGMIMIASLGALAGDQGPSGPPDIPAEPHQRHVRLLHAQRFDLDKPYTHWWRAEHPRVSSGWLLVLSVDPDLVYARQVREPVLYVGNQTAERVNVGYDSGRIVAIVPADVFLTEAPIFFGDPALPEEVDAAHIAKEVSVAQAAGVRPVTPDDLEVVMQDSLVLADDYELRLRAIDLVERYSPQETDLIAGARARRLK